MNLTKIQKLIVEAKGKNVLVSAGAGTGKTRVLVERFLHLVTSGHALVTEILALTFTEKAAAEMKYRILLRLNELGLRSAIQDLEAAYISTFHSFALRMLKENPIEAGVDADFAVFESEEAELLKEQALDEVIEKACELDQNFFLFLQNYGENDVRKGILKCFQAAQVEGVGLDTYFAFSREALAKTAKPEGQRILDLFLEWGEGQLAEDWKGFQNQKSWDWKTLQNFKVWRSSFSRKGGKKHKEIISELKEQLDQVLAAELELKLAPLRETFESVSLAFAERYQTLKKEKRGLDFDDLQIKALELLKREKPGNRMIRKRYQEQFKFIMVDEFQDTNPLQTRLVESLSASENAFFVGDFKQSIYSFRGTSPAHFLEKEKAYTREKGGVRIPLLENFRTISPVVDFVNTFFENLWKEDDLPFEGLLASTTEKSKLQADAAVEWLIVEQEEAEDMEQSRIREARLMADKILEFHDQGIAYGDMAVLFQAMTHVGIYEHALKNAGIPYFIVAGRSFYLQPEIRDMMNFLSTLENPLADIPLAATLRSPFFKVSDDTLFWLSHYAKEKNETEPLYRGLREIENLVEVSETEKIKLRFFHSLLKQFLSTKNKLRIAELLEQILEETSYELAILADRQGVRKFANLRKLVDLAREYEERQVMPLGDFIRAIRRFETHEIRESEAQVEAEKSGRVVRLMTIHSAKGLEFPVVFLSDLGHRRQHPESKTFLAASDRGYSFMVKNPLSLEKEKPASWQILDDYLELKDREEWKRLFYVAATRAKWHLVLTGVYKETKTEKTSFREMSSWMDWLMASAHFLVPDKMKQTVSKKMPLRHLQVPMEKEAFQQVFAKPITTQDSLLEKLGKESKIEKRTEQIFEQIKPQPKAWARAIDLPVSAYCVFRQSPEAFWNIYEMGEADGSGKVNMLPKEEREDSEDPNEEFQPGKSAEFGTAMHRVLERLDLKQPQRQLNTLLEESFYGSLEKDIDEARKIVNTFLESELFLQVQRAKRVYRELPFILNARHGKVHGIIDLVIETEQGHWQIIDYKTAVGNEQKVRDAAYDFQIGIYALALEQIGEKLPEAGKVYFLRNQWTWEIKFKKDVLASYLVHLEDLQVQILEYRKKRLLEMAPKRVNVCFYDA